ncbi:MAG: MFS transporter, partial [Pontixanthobacter sp.]
HTAGYAVQTAFIGAGAVMGSIIPEVMTWMGVSNAAADGGIPDSVRYAFWIGGAALFLSVMFTVATTQEYSPQQMAEFGEEQQGASLDQPIRALASKSYLNCAIWIAAGAAVAAAVSAFSLEKEVYLLGGLLAAYGILSAIAISMAKQGNTTGMLTSIVGDFSGMPDIMKKLALVQFFSWSALFIMWINTTPVVTQYVFGSSDTASTAYNEGANWVGWLFATYNGVAAVAALTLLPFLGRKFGKAKTHMFGLLCGAMGYASFFVIRDPQLLLIAEVGIGIAWASILAMPYAILASSLPQAKLGIYMGLFNVFVVIPQLLVATVMGSIMKAFFPNEPIWTMAFAAGTLVLAALAMMRVHVAGEDTGVSP